MIKDNSWHDVWEEKIPEAESMELLWMIPFWEIFTECVVELNSEHIVTNLRQKAESSIFMKEYVGKSFIELSSEKDAEVVAQQLEQLKNAAVPYLRFQFLSNNGRYYRWTLVPFYKHRIYSGCRGVAVDVTEQTKKEITLSWQSAVIEDGRDFVTIFDTEGNPLYVNPGAYRMVGLDVGAQMPPTEKMFSAEHYSVITTVGIETLSKSDYWFGLGELIRVDGARVPIEHTMYTIKNESGKVTFYVSIIKDITVFIEHEKELEEARKAAEAANEAKGMFLSRMSHEIRTPMNTIIGMINIGLDTDVVGKKDHCLEVARDAAEHLLSIINDILDMSKIEADKLELLYEIFDLNHMLTKIENIMNFSIKKKRLDFSINCSHDMPEFINCDEMRLTQIIVNLLSNAVKFTPENGKVVLNIEKVSENNGDVELKFEVTDTGIGISKEQQKRLFKSFAQADVSITQKYGGTGLGLQLSERLVELMGGEILIESELGKGSKFHFTITVKNVKKIHHLEGAELLEDKSSDNIASGYDFSRYTILIAEDIDINVEIITAILEDTGVAIENAENGRIAVEKFKANPNKYDLILMDVNMPEMDGFEATRAIRALDTEKAVGIPIIAMTANVFKEDIEKCIAVGMNGHTGKPIEANKLFEKLKYCFEAI